MSLKLNSPGGGSITLQEPTTSSDRTLNLPDNTGTLISTSSTFAGTGPAFSAYTNSTQTLTANVATKLSYGLEEFDTNSCYNTSNYRFTPNVAGYYQVNGMFGVATTSGTAIIVLYKNGSNVKIGTVSLGSATSFPYAGISTLIYMNGTTDYLELYGISPSGTLSTWSGSSENNYFQASLVRVA